jgi:DNA polymerase I-like protein with 3'-5' exonuclease and polymerase domains
MITQRKAGPHARIRTINGDNAPYDFTPDDIRETRPEIVTDPSRMYPHGQVKDATEVLRDAPYKSKPLQKYSKSKQAINFLSKWDNPDRPVLRIGTQGPITYSVDSLKVTGRTGVRKPAMQQPPKVLGFRECFVPRPGWLYAGADYSQVEMRCWAQVLEWWELGTTLGDALRAGMDPHVMMGVSLLNASDKYLEDWDYESFLHDLSGANGPELQKICKDARQLAKVANFGLMGGLGPDKLVDYAWNTYELRITRNEAVKLKKLWLKTWPEARRYFDAIASRLLYTDTFTAAMPVTGMLRGGCTFTSGCNTFFQAFAAVGFKAAAWALATEMYVDCGTPLFGCRTVLPLHDEFVIEVPEDRGAEAAERLADVMREVMQEHTPDRS